MNESIQVTACVIMGMLGASFSSLDSRTKVLDTVWHISLGGTLAGLIYPTALGIWPSLSWMVCLLPGFLTGFFVYGIAVAMKRTSKRAEALRPEDILDAILRRNLTAGAAKEDTKHD